MEEVMDQIGALNPLMISIHIMPRVKNDIQSEKRVCDIETVKNAIEKADYEKMETCTYGNGDFETNSFVIELSYPNRFELFTIKHNK